MRRREFITLLGGLALIWPLAALAEERERIRRVGALMNFRSDGPEGQARVAAFGQALQKLGWNEGSNVRTDVRWAGEDADRYGRRAMDCSVFLYDLLDPF